MNTYLFAIMSFIFIFLSKRSFAQNEFFHELVVEKSIIENEKWEFTGEANFKNLYNQPAWRRWGLLFAGIRKIKRFRISGGLKSLYTFNRDITNFFELRPWTALQYNIPIVKKITLRQRLKYEWRFFFTQEVNSSRENYGRLRYQIGIDIPIGAHDEPSWIIRPFFEWFFTRNPARFERFSNERDYGIIVFKKLKNENELFFSYRLEEFYNVNAEKSNGYIFIMGYSF